MLSALFKAFTGRAGGLGSLLALLIVALIAYAVVDRLPKVEQKVLAISQGYLDNNMAAGDTLMSLQADGRDVHLGGEFQDPTVLKAGLESLDGVRSAFLIGSSQSHADAPADTLPADALEEEFKPDKVAAPINNQEGITNVADQEAAAQIKEVVEAVTGLLLKDDAEVASGPIIANTQVQIEVAEVASLTDPASTGAEGRPTLDSDKETASEQTRFEESSLELRYDGIEIKLSGHVGDDKMAELLVEAVSRAVPSYSVLTSDVDGNGKASPLNWMRQFLRIVAGLPEDAQGLISGSDSQGVQIVPDEQQTLTTVNEQAVSEQDPASMNESRELSPARVVVDSESGVPEQEVPDEVAPADSEENVVDEHQPAELNDDFTASNPPDSEAVAVPQAVTDPGEFIVALNKSLSDTAFFQAGETDISEALAKELDQLVQLMQQHPSLYLRIVGNVDSSVGVQFEEFVGMDRARQVQKHLRRQLQDGFRVITTPLPRGYAFDKRVQLVFYISE